MLNGVPRPLASLMLNMLNNTSIGCHIRNCCTNHMFYADDLCVIAPSPTGLQVLLNFCAMFGFENYIKYNPIKSMELDWPHTQKRSNKYNQTSTGL